MRARRTILVLSGAALLLGGCAQGTDESDVSLRVYEGIAVCDRDGCRDERGDEVAGEAVTAGAILSRSASRFDPGVYLYVGAFRADQRFFELEVDIPTVRTGETGVEALYREYLDGAPVFESAVGGGEVRLILEDRAANPPAGRFDLQFEDGRGELRRIIGSFHRTDVPPVSDRPIVEQVDETDREVVYVDYDPTPVEWDIYVDSGCGYETEEPYPEPTPEPTYDDGGGCEGDDGGGDTGGGGGGCEGDSGGYDGGSSGGCEGDSGGGGGCEGDTGGGSGCEGGSGSDCAVAGRGGRGGPSRTAGRLLPYLLVALGRLAGRRR